MITAFEPADSVPGLFDVTLDDGRRITDLTTGQVHSLMASEDWDPHLPIPGTLGWEIAQLPEPHRSQLRERLRRSIPDQIAMTDPEFAARMRAAERG